MFDQVIQSCMGLCIFVFVMAIYGVVVGYRSVK